MKRMNIITGHYGSGKSEFSINFALHKRAGYLVDLDIVNPYFRTRELEETCEKNGIRLISSGLSGALGSDLPYIAKEVFHPFSETLTSVFDLGGDDVGARILRQFAEFSALKDADFLLCVNCRREETADSEGVIRMLRKIEGSSGIKITGLINNTNLLRETSLEDLIFGEKVLKEVAERTGLEIKYTGVHEKLLPEIRNLGGEIIPLKLYLRKPWL